LLSARFPVPAILPAGDNPYIPVTGIAAAVCPAARLNWAAESGFAALQRETWMTAC
jgi:hypothetical protein